MNDYAYEINVQVWQSLIDEYESTNPEASAYTPNLSGRNGAHPFYDWLEDTYECITPNTDFLFNSEKARLRFILKYG